MAFYHTPCSVYTMRLGVLGEEGGGLVVAVAVREEEELLYQTMGHAVEKFHLISRGTVVTASALCCLRMFSLCCFVFAWCQSAMWQRAGYVGPNVCLFAVLEVIEHAVRGWLKVWCQLLHEWAVAKEARGVLYDPCSRAHLLYDAESSLGRGISSLQISRSCGLGY